MSGVAGSFDLPVFEGLTCFAIVLHYSNGELTLTLHKILENLENIVSVHNTYAHNGYSGLRKNLFSITLHYLSFHRLTLARVCIGCVRGLYCDGRDVREIRYGCAVLFVW